MGGKGGGGSSAPSGSTTTTQSSAPWVGQQPFLQGGGYTGADTTVPGVGTILGNNQQSVAGTMPAAAELYANYAPQYFNNSTVSPFTGAQNSALQTLSNPNLASGVSNAATGYSSGTLNNGVGGLQNYASGNMLNSAQPAIDAAVQRATPGLLDSFTGGNRLNSPGAAQAVGSGVAQAAAPYAMQEQQNQIGAAQAQGNIQNTALQNAPLTAALPYAGAQQQLQAGGQMQQQNQAQLNDQINRWNFQQQLPYNKLATYQQMIQGNYGGSGTLTQPYFSQNSGGKGGGSKGTAGQIAQVAIPIAMAAFM